MYWFAMSTEVIKLCGKSTVILGIKRSMHHKTSSIISICLVRITVQFAEYPLQGRVEKDIRNENKQIGGDVKN